MELMDREFVIDHAVTEYQRQQREAQRRREEITYRVYMTDMMREVLVAAGRAGGLQFGILRRWVDLVEERPEDNRSAEEIAADVIKRAGITVIHTGEEQDDGCI